MEKFSNLWVLTKFNLKYFLFPRFNNKKDKIKFIVAMCVIGFAFLIPIASMIAGLYFLITTTQNIEATTNLLSTLFVMSQLATLFFGISTYLQVMYLSKDKSILATLPVSSAEIFISKIITVTVMEMLISVALVLPSTIVTAIALAKIGAHLTVWYFALIPVGIITLPLMVVLLISILSFPLMKIYTFLKKHQTIGAIIVVALIIGIMMAIYIPLYSKIGENSSSSVPVDADGNPIEYTQEEQEQMTRESMNAAMESISGAGKYLYPAKALADAMMNKNVGINLLIYLGSTIIALGAGVALSIFLYQSTLQQLEENGGNSLANADKAYIASDIKKSLRMRELKTTTRDMSKFINFLMSNVMGPAMVFIMIFIMKMNSKGADANDMKYIMAFCKGFAISFALIMVGGSDVAASAGFSLEGKSFAILKTLPISGVDIFKAKLFILDVASLISIVVCSIVSGIMTHFNIVDYIGYIATGSLYVLAINAYGLKRDLKKPKLDWTIIKDITKNNMATLIPMAITLPIAIIGFGIPFAAVFIPNQYAGSAVMWGVMIIAASIYFFTMRFNVDKKINPLFDSVEC